MRKAISYFYTQDTSLLLDKFYFEIEKNDLGH